MSRVGIVLGALLLSVGCAYKSASTLLEQAAAQPAILAVYEHTKGDSGKKGLERLKRLITEDLQIQVVEVKMEEGLLGLASSDTNARVILLNESLEPNGQLEVLAHEAAHHLQPALISKDVAQVFADVVAYQVVQHYGPVNDAAFIAYLSQFKHVFPAVPFLKVDIDLAVGILTGRIPFTGWVE